MRATELSRATRFGIIALALLCTSAAAGAQDIDRSHRPPTPAPPTFKFPHVGTRTLANGVRLIVSEDHALPLVAVRVVLGVDSTYDPPGKEGLYAVTVGAMREGTTTKNAEQLAEGFADIGATVTPTSFTTTSGGFAAGLALMSDMLIHPSLDEAAVERRKSQQMAAVRRAVQSPSLAARHLFNALLYGAENGYVRSLVPTEASIGAVTRDDVARFHRDFIQPQTTTIIVTGDVTEGATVAAVQRAFGDWTRGTAETRTDGEATATPPPTTIYLYDNQNPQAFVYVGGLGPARSAPDYIAADVMGAISGSRLIQALRQRRSLIYAGSSSLAPRRAPLPAAFVGFASINGPKVDSALVEWVAMLRGLRSGQPVSAPELEAVRRNRVGVLPARIEGPDSVATRLAELVRDNVPLDYYDRYAATVPAVTSEQIAATAAKYVDVDHLIIVVTGDRKLLEPAFRGANLPPIVVVDANGKPTG